ncbi:MAG: septum formation initiator family protein [Clostridiales bacterium]|nr:septum formation initiator family protein [Clostridiales bacterium]MDO5141067.1 septum formation initiator family protein [Eubacteriales bacterium]
MPDRRKKKSSNLSSGLAVMGITLIIGIVAATIYTDERDMRRQEQVYIEREASLQKEIEREEQRRKTLEEKKKYVATDEYIEAVAKEKLGLINPDEVLIKAKEE